MADQKYTIFQRLQRVLSNDNYQDSFPTNNYNINSPSDVIATANSREEYDKKILQVKQQTLLAKQWVKANYDIANQSLAGLNDVKLMYRDCDLMDSQMPELAAALDIITEESTYVNDNGCMVNISSRSDRVKNILQDLFVNRLSLHTVLPMICRSTCKYGNTFMLLNIDGKNGVMGWKQLPVYEMERWENGQNTPYTTPIANLNTVDENSPQDTKFVWVGQNEYIPYRNWQIAHFRLLYDSQFLPYGCLVGDTRIETEYSYKEIKDIEIGDKVWTFNVEEQKRELGKVTMKMDKGEKEVYELKTKHYSIEGTSDHKLLVCKNGKLIYEEIQNIKSGDFLVCNNSIKEGQIENVAIDKTPLKEFEFHGKSNKWWFDYINCVPDTVDEEFSELFGFLMGDGWISHGCHVMFALGEYKTLNDKYSSLLEKYSGKKLCYIANTDKNKKMKYHTVYVGSKMLVTILHRMGFIGNSLTKRIPSWVFSSNYDIRKAFLDGLINADGSLKIIGSSKIAYNVELANEQLIKDIKTLALSLGYKVGQIGKRNRIGHKSYTVTKKPIVTTHESFYVNFYKEENVSYKNCNIIKFKNDGFILEKVKSVSPNGVKRTYDITIDNENSNFFANGIITHNCSYLNKARRHWRMLSMMEDMMLLYRLDRSVERRVFKINVGNIDEQDVQAYVQEIANNFKRKPIVDPTTGQIDLRKSFMNVTEDFFVPVRDDNAANPIDTLQGAQNLTAMDDIKFVQNKVLAALRVPRSFLNFEDEKGDGKNLSLLDVRFTRTVNRIQQSLLMELNKIAIIHLYLNGFQDELDNFTLTMNNPSSQAEMLELENLAKKITTAKDAVSDPGGGIPLTSMMWAWKHIFKWSDKEIQQNLEELRLETALSGELQKTMEIIKKTGLFDPVDNIYGETGAEYSEENVEENGNNGLGSGASGGGGPMPIGGGDLDFGDEGGEFPMENGAEGEMDMNSIVQEEGIGGENIDNNSAESGDSAIPNLSDSLLRKMKKNVINEHSKVRKDILKRSEYYTKLLEKRLIEKEGQPKPMQEKAEIYDKAFFLNEEMNNLKNQLEKMTDENDINGKSVK